MLSRSAIVKLKAVLIIDIIIMGAAAGTYFYLQNQGVIAGSATPAKFTLTNLTINPSNATLGDTVQISVNITDSGDLGGNLTLNFEINNAVKYTENVTVAGNYNQAFSYSDTELQAGNYTVKVGGSIGNLTGMFTINPPPIGASKIILYDFNANPYEVWPNQPVNVTATARNPSTEADKLVVVVTVDNAWVETKIIQLNASETQTVEFTVNATIEGTHTVNLNTLSGSFSVVKTGFHTLEVARSGGGPTPLPFTLNGVNYDTPFTEVLPDGQYTVSVPTPYTIATGVVAFSSWQDGNTNPTRTITLDKATILVVTYTVISGYASCPSLFVWNGTGYSYVTDVSNSGWLGYMNYMTSNGQIIYGGGNPWDYVKLDKNLLAVKIINGNKYYDMTLAQQWDELFYLDAAYMVVVDHPAGTSVYTTMSNYANQAFNGQIYTVSQTNTLSPVSATYVWGPAGTNAAGQNVLPDILKLDGHFTPGNNGNLSPSWNDTYLNQLTLDLGNLSNATTIKLVVNGIVDWGSYQAYNNWVNGFETAAAKGLVANGTLIYPAPFMEVKDANGNWIRVPQNKEIPMPSDSNPRTFVMDLTGLFPKGISDYQIRINNFWNVTYDYIGIDTTTQQNITIQKISPIATLSQFWGTQSTSSGNFTRYGNVTAIVQSADDMFVIGRQGDQVSLDFPIDNLTAPAPGMVRDYFLFVVCWFKDPPGQWGYGFSFTVDPLPFQAMSGFPYTADESYPYDAAHLAYLKEYNTRVISPPTS